METSRYCDSVLKFKKKGEIVCIYDFYLTQYLKMYFIIYNTDIMRINS